MEVYLVKSGMLREYGWEWLNLAVYDNNDAAVAKAREVEKEISPEALDETECVEIESFTVRSW